MQLQTLMADYYKGLRITPSLYHEVDYGIHLELGEDIYQMHKDGKLNMKRFTTIYKQVHTIFPLLFNKDEEILLIVNTYPKDIHKTAYPNFFQRGVKAQQKKFALRTREFSWLFDEEPVRVQQMELSCNMLELKIESLLKSVIHEDFGELKPQLRKKFSVYAPDIFLINKRTKCIFHLYDDRGCEIINADETIHNELVEALKDWDIQVKSLPKYRKDSSEVID